MRLPSPLYAILDRSVARGRDLPWLLDAVLAGGCRLVQLREKIMPLGDLLPLARTLARRCREVGASSSSTIAPTSPSRRAPMACTWARTTFPLARHEACCDRA